MTSTEFPETLTTIEDLRALVGRKVTLEAEYQVRASQRKNAPKVTKTFRTIGTIEADDRGQLDERYLIIRRSQGNIIHPEGQRVVKIWD